MVNREEGSRTTGLSSSLYLVGKHASPERLCVCRVAGNRLPSLSRRARTRHTVSPAAECPSSLDVIGLAVVVALQDEALFDSFGQFPVSL